MTDVKEFERFYTRDGFNKSLNHFQLVLSIIEKIESFDNIADIINNLIKDEMIEQHQINPVINSLLVDKYQYSYKSINIEETITVFDNISQELQKWNGIDIVIGYHNPNIGYVVINPKRLESWNVTTEIKKHELLTVYAGSPVSNFNNKISEKAIEEFLNLLTNKKIKVIPSMLQGKHVLKIEKKVKPVSVNTKKSSLKTAKKVTKNSKNIKAAPAVADKPLEQPQQAQPVSSGTRMTPLYSVPVTNELFHNGNVEAWKRIINSYKAKYTGLDVIIFYEGERIHDINTLFKWGKVKHGCAIMFAVAGKNIQDVAKLQRYLRQGASQRFEDFLKFPVNTVLKLF